MRLLSLLTCCLLAPVAQADWQLDNDYSALSFVSVKKAQIAEVHYFKQLSGSVSDDGQVSFEVALNSVDTSIEIRDQRMNELLFETGLFPTAKFTAKVPKSLLSKLAVSDSLLYDISGQIDLHGVTQPIVANVLVTKAGANKMTVSTLKPVIIKAEDFKPAAGVDKLKEVAGLPSITYSVPVSFSLTFTQ